MHIGLDVIREYGSVIDKTSCSGDELLNLLGMPEDARTWTRFDKGAKTYRTTSPSGP